MPELKRRESAAEGARLNREQLSKAGGDVKAARRRRRMTQQQLADRAGLSRPTLSAIERGHGPIHARWSRLSHERCEFACTA
jgi:DNA-binding XRE family transcriptional regulator